LCSFDACCVNTAAVCAASPRLLSAPSATLRDEDFTLQAEGRNVLVVADRRVLRGDPGQEIERPTAADVRENPKFGPEARCDIDIPFSSDA